ncbi:hypothetical protein NKI50_29675 [Mesorhizobium sp. M0563]|uniref:hypothetical protein n=1 Tax=Mesorhizobium sp. M0563 TaxID=2956959 RepID=UPI003339433F
MGRHRLAGRKDKDCDRHLTNAQDGLGKFGLSLEPTKTKLVEFGRFAQRHAGKRGRNRPETIYFLGLTLYCTRNRKGNFKVGMRTEKSRLKRSLLSLRELMRRIGGAVNQLPKSVVR